MVASTDDDGRASRSPFGATVTFSAPGEHVVCPVPGRSWVFGRFFLADEVPAHSFGIVDAHSAVQCAMGTPPS